MELKPISPSEKYFKSSPDGIRTRATALRGRRARPLHNGAVRDQTGTTVAGCLIDGEQYYPGTQVVCAPRAGVPGLEPRLTEPETVGLPITPYPMGAESGQPRIPNLRTVPQIPVYRLMS